MHKKRKKGKKHNPNTVYLLKSNIISASPASCSCLCSAAVSRAHQFFTLPLSLTQATAVTTAPAWATCVCLAFAICSVKLYPTHTFKNIATSLSPPHPTPLCSTLVPSVHFPIHLPPVLCGFCFLSCKSPACHPSSDLCSM